MSKYIAWNDEWILTNKDSYRLVKDLWQAYCENVECIALDAFKAHITRKLGLKANCWWTAEEDAFIKEYFPKIGTVGITELMNNTFGKYRTLASIVNRAKQLGIKVDQKTVDRNHYMLKRKPIGTCISDGMGYERIKVEEGKWVRVQQYIYEKEHGKIPEGYNVVFLDNNPRNYSKENLVAISNRHACLLNTNGFKSKHPEITRTGIKWCELKDALMAQEGVNDD